MPPSTNRNHIPCKKDGWELGISEAAFYNWKSKYGCMEVAYVKRLNDIEEENNRLKKMCADLGHGQCDFKRFVHKKRLGSVSKKQLTEQISQGNCISYIDRA